MNKLKNMLIVFLLLLVGFSVDIDGVAAAQDKINMTCTYKDTGLQSGYKYIINIKNSKISLDVERAENTNIDGSFLELTESSVDNFTIRNFVTPSGITRCPDKISYVSCSTNLVSFVTQNRNYFGGIYDNVQPLPVTGNNYIIGAIYKTGLDTDSVARLFEKNNSNLKFSSYCTYKDASKRPSYAVKKSASSGERVKTNIVGDNVLDNEQQNDDLSNTTGGCGFIGPNTLEIIEWIIRLIRIVVPLLIVVLGIVDFATVVLSGEDKTLKTAGTKFLKRLAAGIILIFIPYILSLLINLSGITGDYNIDPDNLFCLFTLTEDQKTEKKTCSDYFINDCPTVDSYGESCMIQDKKCIYSKNCDFTKGNCASAQ